MATSDLQAVGKIRTFSDHKLNRSENDKRNKKSVTNITIILQFVRTLLLLAIKYGIHNGRIREIANCFTEKAIKQSGLRTFSRNIIPQMRHEYFQMGLQLLSRSFLALRFVRLRQEEITLCRSNRKCCLIHCAFFKNDFKRHFFKSFNTPQIFDKLPHVKVYSSYTCTQYTDLVFNKATDHFRL